MKKNKLRTALTGFAVVWGIFMLIVLLGAGNGLKNGIMHNFREMSTNRVNVWSRSTSMPYKGFPIDRRINFTDADMIALRQEFPQIDLAAISINHSVTASYGDEYMPLTLRATQPDLGKIDYISFKKGNGRFINEMDSKDLRKVIVISPRAEAVLFKGEKALGKFIQCGNTMFKVIGVYKGNEKDSDAPAYIPFVVGQRLFKGGYGYGYMGFTVRGVVTEKECKHFEDQFRERMARRHYFDPKDKRAIGMWMMGNEIRTFNTMMNGIMLFIWIIGLSTLMAGVVGVSNIMLITVRERTREFGIRKALGAKPNSILKLVLIESIMITALFGYIGMLMGIGLTEIINYGMEMAGVGSTGPSSTGDHTPTLFMNPTVNLGISLAATGVLILAGVLAGYFPARKAVKISAIEAMRSE